MINPCSLKNMTKKINRKKELEKSITKIRIKESVKNKSLREKLLKRLESD
jgi:hypothetical protein